jgi:hypothetical protein
MSTRLQMKPATRRGWGRDGLVGRVNSSAWGRDGLVGRVNSSAWGRECFNLSPGFRRVFQFISDPHCHRSITAGQGTGLGWARDKLKHSPPQTAPSPAQCVTSRQRAHPRLPSLPPRSGEQRTALRTGTNSATTCPDRCYQKRLGANPAPRVGVVPLPQSVCVSSSVRRAPRRPGAATALPRVFLPWEAAAARCRPGGCWAQVLSVSPAGESDIGVYLQLRALLA